MAISVHTLAVYMKDCKRKAGIRISRAYHLSDVKHPGKVENSSVVLLPMIHPEVEGKC